MLYNTRSGKVRYYPSSPRRPSRERWSGARTTDDRRDAVCSVGVHLLLHRCAADPRTATTRARPGSSGRIPACSRCSRSLVTPVASTRPPRPSASSACSSQPAARSTSSPTASCTARISRATAAGHRDQPAGRFGGGRRPAVLDYRMGDLRVRRGRAQYPAAVHRREAADVGPVARRPLADLQRVREGRPAEPAAQLPAEHRPAGGATLEDKLRTRRRTSRSC